VSLAGTGSFEIERSDLLQDGEQVACMADRLLHAPGQHLATRDDQSQDMSSALREASEGLRHTDDQWARVATALRPSHDYVTADRGRA